MLVIRLSRTGRNKYPTYRIVAAESARAATGKFVAVLGHYNPHTKELIIQQEETKRYLSNGAQPSNSVIKLLQREGVDLPAWAKLKTKAPKKVEEAAAEATTDQESAPVESAAAEPVAEERVGEVAEETAAAAEDNSPETIDHTDTAADEAEAVDQAESTEEAAAEAATQASESTEA